MMPNPFAFSSNGVDSESEPSPLTVLDSAQSGRIILEDFRPLAESLDWQLGQEYLRQRGSLAFIGDAEPVPFVVNNDGNLSLRAAEVFFAGLVEADRAGTLPRDAETAGGIGGCGGAAGIAGGLPALHGGLPVPSGPRRGDTVRGVRAGAAPAGGRAAGAAQPRGAELPGGAAGAAGRGRLRPDERLRADQRDDDRG